MENIDKKILRDRGAEALRRFYGRIEPLSENPPTYSVSSNGNSLTAIVKTGWRKINAGRSRNDDYWISLRDADVVLCCIENDTDEGRTVRRYLLQIKDVIEAFDKERSRRIADHNWNPEHRTYIDLTDTRNDIARGLINAAIWSDTVAV